MTWRPSRFLRLIGGLLGLATPWFCAGVVEAQQPPNIVFILAGDMGIGDVRAYNPESKIPTPNLDWLAAEGMRLTDAHALPRALARPGAGGDAHLRAARDGAAAGA